MGKAKDELLKSVCKFPFVIISLGTYLLEQCRDYDYRQARNKIKKIIVIVSSNKEVSRL